MSNRPLRELPLISFQEVADGEVIDALGKISQYVVAIAKFLKENELVLPEVFDIDGSVRVTEMPDIKVSNLSDLDRSFRRLEDQFSQLGASLAAMKQTDDTPNEDIQMLARTLSKNFMSMEKAIAQLGKKLGEEKVITVDSSGLPQDFAENMKGVEGWIRKLYEYEVEKPTFVPPPVTNVSINALKGVPKATQIFVTSAAAMTLPATNLANRRSLIVFNNDPNITLYVGDSAVSTTAGLPILAQTYSPSFDLGEKSTLYGIAASSTIDVRVFEVSDVAVGR